MTALAEKPGVRWTVLIVNFLILAAAYASLSTWSVAVPFVQRSFHLTAGQVQLGASVLILGYAIGSFAEGQIAARIGMKKTGVVALLLLLIAQALIPIAPVYWLILVLRFIQGWGIIWFLATNMTTPFFPLARRGLAAGIIASAIPFGVGMGGILAGLVLSRTGSWTQTFFYFDGLLLIIAALWFVGARDVKTEPEIAGSPRPRGQSPYRSRVGWLVAMCTFCSAFQLLGLYTILPTYAYALGYSPSQAGTALLVGGLSGAVTAPIGGIVSDALITRGYPPLKARAYVMALGGFLIAALGTFLLPFVAAAGFAVLMFIIVIAGWNAASSLIGALPTELMSTPESAGKLFGLVILVGLPGGAISPYVATLIAANAGWTWAFALLGIVALAGVILGMLAPRVRDARDPSAAVATLAG